MKAQIAEQISYARSKLVAMAEQVFPLQQKGEAAAGVVLQTITELRAHIENIETGVAERHEHPAPAALPEETAAEADPVVEGAVAEAQSVTEEPSEVPPGAEAQEVVPPADADPLLAGGEVSAEESAEVR